MSAKLGGIKGGKYQLGQNCDLNVTPFVDVMLVLLIIFMVSAPIATVAIKIDLPPAVNDPSPPKDPVYLSLKEDGHIYIVAQPTTIETLGADLAARFHKPDPQAETVLIRADRLVRYRDFMAVVNRLQLDGFYKVSLINENLNPTT